MKEGGVLPEGGGRWLACGKTGRMSSWHGTSPAAFYHWCAYKSRNVAKTSSGARFKVCFEACFQAAESSKKMVLRAKMCKCHTSVLETTAVSRVR